ncbi:MAG: bifunctional phosphoglucose/phosphomannose isomerase [Candidatus Kapaibacteriales bacterium]
MIQLNSKTVQMLDSAKMFEILKTFPQQLLNSLNIANSIYESINFTSNRFLLLGMGGSAIAGDLLQTYFRNSNSNVYLTTNRNYLILNDITPETVVIASSYSGNTEETLYALKIAMEKTQKIFGICSGGLLEEELKKDNLPVVKIPNGLQPRAALGYSFFSLLLIINKIVYGVIPDKLKYEIENLYLNLEVKSKEYSKLIETNPAIELASKLYGKIVIIYASEETFFPVAIRFRSQIQENAKNLAFANSIPEMNHNEINSFNFPKNLLDRLQIVLLSDEMDFPANKKRIQVLTNILSAINQPTLLKSEGRTFLQRMFELIYFLDWTSYFLALMNGVDPTPIPLITTLKNELKISNI